MNKNELKHILKPLIKKCIKEVLLEEGVLSGVISEVVTGLKSGGTLNESKKSPSPQLAPPKKNKQNPRLLQARKKLMEAVGKNAYNDINLFEGTDPLRSEAPAGSGALSDTDPKDPGIDISIIPGAENWSKMI